MLNVWPNCVNLIFLDDTTIEIKLLVQDPCSAPRDLQNCRKIFLAWYGQKD